MLALYSTKSIDELFKKLVGDRYDDFITKISAVFYSELIWNDKEVKVGESYLKGIAATVSTLDLMSIYMPLLMK